MDNFIHANNGVVYSKSSTAAYKTGVKVGHTSPILSDQKSDAMGDMVPWGADNLFPQRILKESRKNTIVGTTLDKQARIAYSEIEYGYKKVENGVEVFERVIDPKVEAFLRRSKINRFTIAAYRSLYWFYNLFPELRLTADRSEVYSIKLPNTSFCRYGKQNSKGEVESLYICADWETVRGVDDPSVSKVPVIPIYEDPESIKERKDSWLYIYPISYPTENEVFYSLTDWNSLRLSGWLEVAQAIPQFKKALFENQITIKYIVEVPTWWWNWKYPGFDGFTTEKKQELMDYELDKFETWMKGNDNAGNSMLVTVLSDPQRQIEYKGWDIKPVDNKIKDGIYIEDSNEASSHLLYALGIDPAIIGSQPGTKMGGGGGSDKRVAINIYTENILAHQDIILEVFYWISEYNKWPYNCWRFKNSRAMGTEGTPPSKDPLKEPQQQAS
jgi:hypothetical protein